MARPPGRQARQKLKTKTWSGDACDHAVVPHLLEPHRIQRSPNLGAAAGLADGAEDEGVEESSDLSGHDDGRVVDGLSDLSGVEIDECVEADALAEQLASEGLSGRPGTPDKGAVSTGEERAAEDVDLEAAEGGVGVCRVCPRGPGRTLPPVE